MCNITEILLAGGRNRATSFIFPMFGQHNHHDKKDDGVKVPVFDRESPGSGRAASIQQPTQNVFFEIVKVRSMLMIDNGIQSGAAGALRHV